MMNLVNGRARLPRGFQVLVVSLLLPMGLGCLGDDDAGGSDAGGGVLDGGGAGDGGGGVGDGGGSADANLAQGEPAGLIGITNAHNLVRAEVGVGPMTWDPALAAIAQAWAESCTDTKAPAGLVDHNDGRSDNYPGYVGENIYGSSGTATAQGAVDSWAGEKQYYDYPSNTCESGRVCGHYTQVVWRNSTKLGCGIANCPALTYGSSLVCNYAPGGNFGGQSPY